jgi:hypothetical protein
MVHKRRALSRRGDLLVNHSDYGSNSRVVNLWEEDAMPDIVLQSLRSSSGVRSRVSDGIHGELHAALSQISFRAVPTHEIQSLHLLVSST